MALPPKARDGQRGGVFRRAFATVPRPLAAILTVVLIVGLAWALLVPPWQAPDAPQHFAYAQSLAERFALPVDQRRRALSSAQSAADLAVGASNEAFYPDVVKPDWSAAGYARYLASARSDPSRSNGGGTTNASANPPLYYLYADLAYWPTESSNAFDSLYAIQIWGIALLLLTATGAWLLAGEVLGHRRLAQLACAAVAGLIPQETFISTSVNPDALLVALWTLALWLGARVIVRGAQRRDAVALCAVTAAAILTKATAYALVPPVLLALLIGWRRRPAAERRAMLRPLGFALLALIVPVLAWVGYAKATGHSVVNGIGASPGAHAQPFNVRQFVDYVWQFYLPRLPFMTRFPEDVSLSLPLPVYYFWIREGWGVFGWLDVVMPAWVYGVLVAISALIVFPALALLARFRDRLRLELADFFALALVALLGLLHVSDYRSIIAGDGPLVQGRYLLPLVALLGLAVGLLLSRLPARWRPAAGGIVLAALLVLQVLALGTIARTYYT
jgi:4-amino-4-deoxy-L-arabinose transferase-like glycosyltransferase